MLSIINKKCSPQWQNYGHSKVFTPVKVAEKITGKSSLIKAFAHTIGNSVVWLRIWIMKVWQIIFGSRFSDIYLIKGDLSSVLLLSGYGLVFFVLVLFIYIYTIYIYYIYNTYIYIYIYIYIHEQLLVQDGCHVEESSIFISWLIHHYILLPSRFFYSTACFFFCNP